MATIEPYQTKAGKRYMVRYRTSDHRQSMKRGFIRKADAQAWLDDNATDIRTGHYVKPSKGKTKVGEVAEQWAAARRTRIKPSTAAREAGYLTTYIRPRWGNVALSAVTRRDVQEWLNGIADSGMSPSTVRQVHWALSSILELAVADGYAAENAAKKKRRGSGAPGIELPREQRRPRTYLNPEQLLRLADAAGPVHDIVLTLGLTGLRVGELTALTVADVDTNRRRLNVSKSTTDVAGTLTDGDTKTGAARQVSYPRTVEPILRAAMTGKRSSALLFALPGGGQVRTSNLRARYLRPAQAVAGTAVTRLQDALNVPQTGRMDDVTVDAVKAVQEAAGQARTGVVGPDVWQALNVHDEPLNGLTLAPRAEDFGELTVHDLRHTAASIAIHAGANAKAVQRMLGHASAAMTLDVYADLFDDDLDVVADAIDTAISSVNQ